MKDFPAFEVFQDCKGKEIKFSYTMFDAGHLFSLRAREVTKKDWAREFTAYDITSPVNALIKIRTKIREELNKRYFTENQRDSFAEMNFDYFRGNIELDSDNHQICLVVDGKKMSVSDLESILSTHEGFQIEIRITDE